MKTDLHVFFKVDKSVAFWKLKMGLFELKAT